MTLGPRMKRVGGFALLLLSTAIGSLLPAAHAYAEIEGASTEIHIEQPGSERCPAAHDEIACQLCRVQRLVSRGSHGGFELSAVAATGEPATERRAWPALRWREPASSPRAPPVLAA